MLIEYIERMRTRPPHERTRFALLMAGSVTGVVVALWGLTLPARFAAIQVDVSTEEAFLSEENTLLQEAINKEEFLPGGDTLVEDTTPPAVAIPETSTLPPFTLTPLKTEDATAVSPLP